MPLVLPTSLSVTPSSRPCIQVLMLWMAEDCVAPSTLGVPRPSGLHFLLNNGIHNCSATFLHGVNGHVHLCSSPGPTDWTTQAEPNIPCIAIEEPLLEGKPSKEQDCLPGAKTTALVIWSAGQASFNILAISDHSMHGRVRVDHPSPPWESLVWIVDIIKHPIIRGGWIDKSMPKRWWAYRGLSTWVCESKRCLGRHTQLWCYIFHQILASVIWLTSMKWWNGEGILVHSSPPLW